MRLENHAGNVSDKTIGLIVPFNFKLFEIFYLALVDRYFLNKEKYVWCLL